MPTKVELEEELTFLRVELERSKEDAADYERQLDEQDTELAKREDAVGDMEAFIEWARPYVQSMAQDAITAGSVGDANMIRDLANVF